MLRHDRAGAGRRLRPVDAADRGACSDGDDCVINGRKWLITGADGAAFAIIMARCEDGRRDDVPRRHGRSRASRSSARWTRSTAACPAATRWSLRRPARAGDATCSARSGEGFRYAQVRLAPARLTHCMRWLGAARRAHDIAVDYARTRQAFGKPLAEHEGVGFMLADNEMDLHTCAAGDLALRLGARPGRARPARVEPGQGDLLGGVWRVVDRCVQVLGGPGVTRRDASSRASSPTSAPSASTTAPPRCTAGRIAKRILKSGLAGGDAERHPAHCTRALHRAGGGRDARHDRRGRAAAGRCHPAELAPAGPRRGRKSCRGCTLVLRTDAPSAVAASHGRAQEFALLQAAAHAGVTVPQPLWLCEDPAVIGRPFFVMRCVEGTAAGHLLDARRCAGHRPHAAGAAARAMSWP